MLKSSKSIYFNLKTSPQLQAFQASQSLFEQAQRRNELEYRTLHFGYTITYNLKSHSLCYTQYTCQEHQTNQKNQTTKLFNSNSTISSTLNQGKGSVKAKNKNGV